MIGKTISHYRILQKLGGGGMGVVYKAEDTRLKRTVALKFLPSELTEDEREKRRFMHEAQAASALEHTNICNIHEIDETDDGQMFIVMSYYDGETLKNKIERGLLPIDQVLTIAIQIAEGLAKAHERGIVHRDIKPANVMVTSDGVAKIVDFGLAKLKGLSSVTIPGTTMGTAAYMSPEQARGEEADPRADVWSLGVLLYEMVTGQLPFRGNQLAVIHSILKDSPAAPSSLCPDVPVSLETVINGCLKKDRRARFQTAKQVANELCTVKQEISPTVQPQLLRKRSRLWLAAAALVVVTIAIYSFFTLLPKRLRFADRKSVAVLPFKNFSDDRANEYFSDGITEDIIAQLSKIRDLKVISRTSVMRYKNSDKSLREIGKDLGVATVLEGSVRRAGNQLRIVSQLIDSSTDEHIWTETYDREMKDIFSIQSDVAQKIAAALKATLSPAEKERLEKRPTSNLTAYDYYLKGREYYYNYRKQDNEHAIELFQRALELDPDYALAHAGLADSYGQRVAKFGFPRTWLNSAIEAGTKAISIDPNLAEGHKALGLAYEGKGWLHRALQAYGKSIELNANYYPAVGNFGFSLLRMGQLDEALPWLKKSTAIAPTAAINYVWVGRTYLYLGDDSNGEEWIRKASELQPDLAIAQFYLGAKDIFEGNYARAAERSRQVPSSTPDDIGHLALAGYAELLSGHHAQAKQYFEKLSKFGSTGETWTIGAAYITHLGYVLWKTNQQDEARKWFRQSLKDDQTYLEEGSESYQVPYDIAAVHAIQGDKAEACKWLQRAIDAGWRNYRYSLIDPLLENLRDDQRFKQMMADLQRRVDEMRRRVESQ